MKIELSRKNEAFHFEATNETNLSIPIDGSAAIGGENKGFTPMELMLSGMTACSTIDILLILKKQKQNIEDIKVSAEAERTTTDAKSFKRVKLHYTVTGKVATAKLERAIDLALTKYCSAILSLHPQVVIESGFEIR